MRPLVAASRRAHRGASLLEVLATATVLLVGLGAALWALGATGRQNRHNLSQLQAHLLAERELEAIRALGCERQPPLHPCADVQAAEGRAYSAWQAAAGEVSLSAQAGAREYRVLVDVDPPLEGGAAGQPALGRLGTGDNTVNVRVTVSWQEPGRPDWQVVALQTRMSP